MTGMLARRCFKAFARLARGAVRAGAPGGLPAGELIPARGGVRKGATRRGLGLSLPLLALLDVMGSGPFPMLDKLVMGIAGRLVMRRTLLLELIMMKIDEN
jgi:hypothetical protein